MMAVLGGRICFILRKVGGRLVELCADCRRAMDPMDDDMVLAGLTIRAGYCCLSFKVEHVKFIGIILRLLCH